MEEVVSQRHAPMPDLVLKAKEYYDLSRIADIVGNVVAARALKVEWAAVGVQLPGSGDYHTQKIQFEEKLKSFIKC
jgi:hypothetical protein